MRNFKSMIKMLFNEFTKNFKSYFWFILIISIYLLYFAIYHHGETNCLVKRTIGFPCPGCGMSRASIYFITLQFRKAFYFHPFVFVMPFIFIVVFFKNLKFVRTIFYSKVFWSSIIILFIGIYIIRMILLFPDTVPMDYYENSILKKIFL